MEEMIKTRIILILLILCVIFFIGMVSSCTDVYRQKAGREKEMAVRLDLEEKMSKFSQEKAMLEEKLKEKEKELVQEELASQDAKEELAKVTKLKETLEEDLKEALVSGKKSKK